MSTRTASTRAEPWRIRDARADDAASLAAIYAPFVRDTAITFEYEAPDTDEFAERIARAQRDWAWLVAETATGCAGYAYGTSFRARPAYRFTVETSAYVDPAWHGRGVARALYERLFEVLAARGFCTAIAVITLPNAPSVAFHERLGFTCAGVTPQVGRKFDAWHDVGWYQRRLRDDPPEEDPTSRRAAASGQRVSS